MKFSKHFQRVRRLGREVKRAFALGPTNQPLSREDEALLDKMATVVVARGMASPAVLFLETLGPMNFLGSQALHFLTPIISLACDTRELEQAGRLLERRDAIPKLISLIEAKANTEKPSSG